MLLFLGFEVSASDKYGGQLVFSTTSDPKSFNEILAKETSTSEILGYLFEGLTAIDGETAQVKPALAESWDVDPSGLVWTFHLRADAAWSDGVPFTSDDVVFTFNDLIYNDAIPSSARDIFSVEGKNFEVSRVDDHTVRFTLPVRFAPFLRGMTQSILPRHKLKSAVDDGTFMTKWGIDTPPPEIIGTGPYRLTRYQPGQRIVLERNPLYWKTSVEGDRLPYIEKIIYLIIQSQDIELLKFIDGELDSIGVRAVDYPILKPLEDRRNFTIYDLGPAFGTNFIIFNQNQGVNPSTKKPFVDPYKLAWFTNQKFRQALAHAVDRDRMIQIVMSGWGSPQHGSMSPSAGFFYNPDITVYDYDLDKAREILKEEGFWDRDGDGVIEDSSGHPVEFTFNVPAGTSEREQIAAIIRADMEKIGIKANFITIEFNSLVAKLTSTFDWDVIMIGLTGGVEPHFGKNVWHSSGGLHMWYPNQQAPATEWEKRIDEIFDTAVQELDENKRKVLYDEYQRIIADQSPVIYTVLNNRLSAVRNKFGNLHPSAYGGIFHNLEEIYILPEYQ